MSGSWSDGGVWMYGLESQLSVRLQDPRFFLKKICKLNPPPLQKQKFSFRV